MTYKYAQFWDDRYRDNGSDQGVGSLGQEGKLFSQAIRDIVKEHEIVTMLDIGCGACKLWRGELPVQEKYYVGLDVSEKAIDAAKEKHPAGWFICRDLTKQWPFGTKAFDLVLSTDVLFHIKPEDYELVVKRIFKTAKRMVLVKTIEYTGGDYQFNNGPVIPPEGWTTNRLEPVDPGNLSKYLYLFRRGNNEKSLHTM